MAWSAAGSPLLVLPFLEGRHTLSVALLSMCAQDAVELNSVTVCTNYTPCSLAVDYDDSDPDDETSEDCKCSLCQRRFEEQGNPPHLLPIQDDQELQTRLLECF
ncbi:hypothetical protein C0J52_04432 [Blattella germanica]|nr:hypothetical protein C0J52_04432 [Blattella germanica]